jgi:hypothetical protein
MNRWNATENRGLIVSLAPFPTVGLVPLIEFSFRVPFLSAGWRVEDLRDVVGDRVREDRVRVTDS